MKTSESTSAVWAAYVAAYADSAPLLRNSVNPHFRSKYADLAAVCAVVGEAFAPHGLAVVQTVDDGTLVTRVIHNSGEWFETTCPIVDAGGKSPVHAFGSSLTYSRRYSLMALAGLAPEDDDGGNPNRRLMDKAKQRTWHADRAAFEQSLARMGTTLDEVDAMCGRLGEDPPSKGDGDRRDGLLRWLHSREGKAALHPPEVEPEAHDWPEDDCIAVADIIAGIPGPRLAKLVTGITGREAPHYVEERQRELRRLLRGRWATGDEAVEWLKAEA